ncbi:MAG TPA: hypothetical protein VIP51_02490 [Eoetvoesiella sp.]
MTPTITVPLYRLAHGRTGDKGNRSNISVIAWHPELYPILKDQVSEARVAQLFSYRKATQVTRYCVDTLAALNFVIDGVLDGGVNSSLNLDAHGKALSYLLLDLPVSVPVDLAGYLVGPEETTMEVESLQT